MAPVGDSAPPPLNGVRYRFVTHNLWGVSVRDPLTRPLACCDAMLDLAQKEGWVDEPLVMGLQEVYAFRLDPISHALVGTFGWLERQCAGALRVFQYIISLILHGIIIFGNSVLPYLFRLNQVRFDAGGCPEWLYDVKQRVLPKLACFTDSGHCIGHSELTLAREEHWKSSDGGCLLLASGGLKCDLAQHSGFVQFTHASGSIAMCNRGLLYMVMPEQKIAVITTHMQALDDPLRALIGHDVDATYAAQIQQIRALVKQLEVEHALDYVFVLGDLNTMHFTTAEVEARFGLHKLNLATDTHVSDGCVDHVLCTQRIPEERVRARHVVTPSDHKMVVVEIL